MATGDLTLADLVAKFGSTLVNNVFCDDGSGEPGPRLLPSLRAGRRIGDAVLLTAWTVEQISELVANDDAVRSAMLSLAMSEGMEGRIEWDSDGGPRERMRKAALETLRLLAKAEERSVAERKAGANPHASVGRVNTRTSPNTFVFAPSRSQPRRGGF
jgi:hypothetical protein